MTKNCNDEKLNDSKLQCLRKLVTETVSSIFKNKDNLSHYFHNNKFNKLKELTVS